MFLKTLFQYMYLTEAGGVAYAICSICLIIEHGMFKDSSPGKVEVILQSYECGNEEFCAVVGICDFTLH